MWSSEFLSNVALLTMVEKIRQHTDLSLDEDSVDRLEHKIFSADELSISNER